MWNEFCDWYIEFSKARLGADADPADRAVCQRNLVFVLGQILRLLHPIMPFVTEQVYGEMPKDADAAPMLIVAAWPDAGRARRLCGRGRRAGHCHGVRGGGCRAFHPGALRHLPKTALPWP